MCMCPLLVRTGLGSVHKIWPALKYHILLCPPSQGQRQPHDILMFLFPELLPQGNQAPSPPSNLLGASVLVWPQVIHGVSMVSWWHLRNHPDGGLVLDTSISRLYMILSSEFCLPWCEVKALIYECLTQWWVSGFPKLNLGVLAKAWREGLAKGMWSFYMSSLLQLGQSHINV